MMDALFQPLADLAHLSSLAHWASDFASSLPSVLAQAGTGSIQGASAPPQELLDGTPDSHLLAWLSRYGATFIFFAFIVCGIGLHISEDFLLIPAGVAIYHGQMDWGETLLAAYAGLVIGDTAWIWMCRHFGTRIIHSKRLKRLMHPRRLLEAKYAMEKRGTVVLILARFIPGTRTAVLTMTGVLHVPWWKFLAVELTTVAVTAPIQIGIGWIGAAGYDHAKALGSLLTIGFAVTALSIGAWFVWTWRKESRARRGPRPRSPVAWLRTFGATSGARPLATPNPSAAIAKTKPAETDSRNGPPSAEPNA